MPESLLKESLLNEKQSRSTVVQSIPLDDQVAPDEAEFFSTLHPALSRALLYIILTLVTVGLLWAGFGKVDVVSTAPFRLVPLGRIQTVQVPRSGEIELIGIKEGELVAKGQMLFKLKSRETLLELREQARANGQFLKAKYDLLEALPQKQLLAQETIATLENRLRLTQTFMLTHREALQAYRKELGKGAVGLEEDVQAEIRFRSAELEHLKQKYTQSQKLFEKGLISPSMLSESRIRYFGALAALPTRMSDIRRHETSMQDLKRQILEVRINLEREVARTKYAYEEAKVFKERADLAVDRALESDLDLILAPESGIVTQVFVNTVGQVIDKGQTLATLAPSSSPMVAEVLILNKDVGLMELGQTVKLKYDAFAFEDYGIKLGRLIKVSPDAILDQTLGPVYLGIVELQEATVQVGLDKKPLIYGMKGISEVVTSQQSVLSLLLTPLRQLYESTTFVIEEEKG